MTVPGPSGERSFREGEWISIDGTAGEVIEGKLDTRPSEVVQVLVERSREPRSARVYQEFAKLLAWADGARRLKVRANADQPDQAATSVAFGAQGIGLCRTEHMFFGEGKIGPMREMIVADNEQDRRAALAKLLPLQREDFKGLFIAMAGRPVTIRTLDPPLHEFLPHDEGGIADLARATGKGVDEIRARIEELAESNPMLGHRGCRLGITFPEITKMQAQAIFEAAVQCAKEGIDVIPEVMIPLVGNVKELADQKRIVVDTATEVFEREGRSVKYMVGTMIEVPRGALTADEIAEEAEFFSFGTNDLTQTTFGFSRDDSGGFIGAYLEKGILAEDPFQVLDQTGVGQLIKIAVEKGRKTNPELEVGICGEHGGEPKSVKFCANNGLNYVSCSPYRVPIARLAAAQAAIEAEQ
jgi:pyruvate,orthophosphate dikinase